MQILKLIEEVTPKPASILPFHGHFIQETAVKDRDYCFVFDLLDKSLSKHMVERKNSGKRFNISELRRLYTQLLHGMAFLQSIGVSHRDLKPGNLMMDDQGSFRIIDFGLSVNILELLKAQQQGQSKTISKVLVEMGGTEEYFSPEMLLQWINPQASQVELNSFKSDVFSFGLILLEAATFRKIQHHNDPALQRKSVQENLRIFAASANSYASPKERKDFQFLLAKLERCVAFDPQNRPHFIDLFKEDLQVERIPHHIWIEEQVVEVVVLPANQKPKLELQQELESENARLREENGALKAANAQLGQQLAALKQKNLDLFAQCEQFKATIEKQEEERKCYLP